MSNDHNILKCRDDHTPVLFSASGDVAEPGKPFKLIKDVKCSWLNQDEAFGPEKLRTRIEPWLTALFQSEHLSLLVGSGLTYAVHCIATGTDLRA